MIDSRVATDFVSTFTGEVADDLARAMNCVEIDVLAEMLESLGAADLASVWLDAHAEGDEEGDLHYRRVHVGGE
ncbi:hypothetical protein [Streptomyces phytophilus]|uniref:hypothetical protein n=1 Tax=Streptomyces phytophilus TaxID=722715 RepID=UPI0015F0608A|nr:hypothetical protein [Streptomyces phytophilus]